MTAPETMVSSVLVDGTRGDEGAGGPGRAARGRGQGRGPGRLQGLLAGLGVLAALLLLWELGSAAGWLDANYFPRPSNIVVQAMEPSTREGLFEGLLSTLRRYSLAFVLSGLAGVLVGLLMGYFAWVHAALEPLTEILRPIPTPAYIPLAILVLGIGDEMKIAVTFSAGFFPVLINTVAGVRSVNPALRETARLLSFSSREELRMIVAPAALPSIMTGLRVSLGVTLLVSVVAEMIATGGDGIGFFVLDAQRTFRIKDMYVGIGALGLIGYALNHLFLVAERRVLTRWAGVTAP
jgi:ABC-type nitrate/sulfonate/bicarbonate transport system permease component